ncbi:metal-dependent hydrolase [Massilia sp. PWRC2]|uniref:metal-dependent hydrolase n=1 Tax=Massilia sp. PWRC2 TaxID=2804626 RepID=UPI003CF9CB31
MDNITHTIIGLAVGEVIYRSVAVDPLVEPVGTAETTRHRLLLTACAAASNFPDLDLVLVKLLPDPLGYLLQHRGHTHTLLLEIPQALLLCALLWLLWPAARRLLQASSQARTGLALAIVGGFLLHIGMDFLNSYGVHPFYPFDARWRFGDLVFIVEPLFWVAAGVPLLMTVRRRPLRWGWAIGLTVVLAAAAANGVLHWASLVLLATIGLVTAAASTRVKDKRESKVKNQVNSLAGLALGLAVCVGFVGVQAAASNAARAMLQDEMALRAPGAHLVDAALTAYPANPFCWNFAAIEVGASGDAYHVRRGVLSLAPALLPVAACPSGLTGAMQAAPAQAIAVLSDDAGSLSLLRQRAASDCWLSGWLRFARIPLLHGAIASDLRFSNALAPNFTTIDLDRYNGHDCPAPLPAWGMPRADLLAR